MQTLKLVKPHCHQGKPYQVGEILSVNDFDAEWLIARGIAKAHKSTTLKQKESKNAK